MFLRSGRTHYYECSPTKKQYWLSLILPRPVKKAKKSSINKWFWWGFLKAELVSCGIGFKWYLFRRPFISALRQPHFLETHFQNHFFEIHHFHIIHQQPRPHSSLYTWPSYRSLCPFVSIFDVASDKRIKKGLGLSVSYFQVGFSRPDWPIWGKKLRLQSVMWVRASAEESPSFAKSSGCEWVQSSGPIQHWPIWSKKLRLQSGGVGQVRPGPEEGLRAIYWGVQIWVQL